MLPILYASLSVGPPTSAPFTGLWTWHMVYVSLTHSVVFPSPFNLPHHFMDHRRSPHTHRFLINILLLLLVRVMFIFELILRAGRLECERIRAVRLSCNMQEVVNQESIRNVFAISSTGERPDGADWWHEHWVSIRLSYLLESHVTSQMWLII